MSIFIFLASLLSALVASPSLLAFIYGPASVLSFPFYAEQPVSISLHYYRVHFLTWVIYPIDASAFVINPFTFAFLLFILVNSVGAALGYLMNKKHIFPERYGWIGLLLLVFLSVFLLVIGNVLYNSRVWHTINGFHVYTNRDFDAWRFWTFGFTWLAVVFGDLLLYRPKTVKREISEDLMKNLEAVLGALVFLLSILSILVINFGVVPSTQFLGHYTYSGFAHFSRFYFFPLLLFAGLIAIGHAVYANRRLELGLSIITMFWGVFAWLWVAMSLIDGDSPYIKGSVADNLMEMSLLVLPGILLGTALTLDGMRRKTPPLGKNKLSIINVSRHKSCFLRNPEKKVFGVVFSVFVLKIKKGVKRIFLRIN